MSATATRSRDGGALEGGIINGDLSGLTASQRQRRYRECCEAAGLDPRSRPLEYLRLDNRLMLYAKASAADQLISNRKLTVEIVDRRLDPGLGIFEVRCRVKFPDGQHVEDFAALDVGGQQEERLCQSLMKTITRAKRRAVLSACGLAMLDESELASIPDAVRVDPDADESNSATPIGLSSLAREPGAGEEEVESYSRAIRRFVESRNAHWLEECEAEGEPPTDGDLLQIPRTTGRLLVWGLRTGRLRPTDLAYDPQTGRPTERVSVDKATRLVASLFAREPDALLAEAEAFSREEIARMRRQWRPPDPESPGADFDDLERTEAGVRG